MIRHQQNQTVRPANEQIHGEKVSGTLRKSRKYHQGKPIGSL